MDRILIAGTHSGCGKTTVTTGILCALKARGVDVAAFKCGPDYIDPMFHREAIGVPSHNLDPFFSSDGQLRERLSGAGLAVIEGVMGYYDGIGTRGDAGTYQVARATGTPVVLVVNAEGMYTSAGAIIKGFVEFRAESNIRGVIFNNASRALYQGLKQIALEAGVTPLGFLPHNARVSVGSRHLGLITAGELDDLREKLQILGVLAEEDIDLDGLLALASGAPELDSQPAPAREIGHVRVAVARDRAFCFIYQENLELLRDLGCELVFFSPLKDGALPDNIGGLYLPGGYPELYLDALSGNEAMRRAVREAVLAGLPTVAECGGFMYLCDTLDGIPMAGAVRSRVSRTDKLQRFGYATLCAEADNLLCRAGEAINVHEFHFYDSSNNGSGFTARKPESERSWRCVHATETLYAGFPHLYFPANPAFAENFVRKACNYAK